MDKLILNQCTGFEWDAGNHHKNQKKHNASQQECEQVFFNEPLLLFTDEKHSQYESRYYVLGKTNDGRKLFIAFTIRDHSIRVISARDMSKRERYIYEHN